ncbi:hypothetical protein FB45DRAFT_1057190 [Roridomyces roridus]|uniref:Uncharacterized protein n=1 Tax=Roridomyces roridus TaxID=1738132 RepID=A0AAD7C0A6_9AGAR|nr:hypothetical protein FB45DRAFT_1057190 [Roridomyces roridus]
MTHPYHPPVPPPSLQATIQLPRTLPRPPSAPPERTRAGLDVFDPGLAEYPLPFIQMQLVLCAESLLRGLRDVSSLLPPTLSVDATSPLPSSISVDVPISVDTFHPTHILAAVEPVVSNSNSDSEAPTTITLIPIHGAVFGAHSTAPILQPTPVSPDVDGDVQQREPLVLPLVPITLPSIPAFLAIRSFMYTHSADSLLSTLLPPLTFTAESIKMAAEAPGRLRLAHLLRSAYPSPRDLLQCAERVHDVWRTVCGLEIGGDDHGDAMWDAIWLAWEVVLGALSLVALRGAEMDGQVDSMESPVKED